MLCRKMVKNIQINRNAFRFAIIFISLTQFWFNNFNVPFVRRTNFRWLGQVYKNRKNLHMFTAKNVEKRWILNVWWWFLLWTEGNNAMTASTFLLCFTGLECICSHRKTKNIAIWHHSNVERSMNKTFQPIV